MRNQRKSKNNIFQTQRAICVQLILACFNRKLLHISSSSSFFFCAVLHLNLDLHRHLFSQVSSQYSSNQLGSVRSAFCQSTVPTPRLPTRCHLCLFFPFILVTEQSRRTTLSQCRCRSTPPEERQAPCTNASYACTGSPVKRAP